MRQADASRRDFLRAAAASALVVPAAAAYGFYRSARGEPCPLDAGTVSGLRAAGTTFSPPSGKSPILLVTDDDASNPFGPFLAEILSAEGLLCFDRAQVSAHDTLPASLPVVNPA